MWLQFAFSSLLVYVSGKSCIHTANLLVAVSPAPHPPPSVFKCWFPTMLFITSFLVYLFSVHVAHPTVCLNCVHYCAVSLPQAANFHTLSFINDTYCTYRSSDVLKSCFHNFLFYSSLPGVVSSYNSLFHPYPIFLVYIPQSSGSSRHSELGILHWNRRLQDLFLPVYSMPPKHPLQIVTILFIHAIKLTLFLKRKTADPLSNIKRGPWFEFAK